MTARGIFIGIVVAAAGVALFLWWYGYYTTACVADGHSKDWCWAQFWQTL